MFTLKLTEERQVKSGSKFVTTEKTEKVIDSKQYNNITNSDTLKWFRRLGGTESAQKNYTSRGYNIVKLISTSPDKSERVVRIFDFD